MGRLSEYPSQHVPSVEPSKELYSEIFTLDVFASLLAEIESEWLSTFLLFTVTEHNIWKTRYKSIQACYSI